MVNDRYRWKQSLVLLNQVTAASLNRTFASDDPLAAPRRILQLPKAGARAIDSGYV